MIPSTDTAESRILDLYGKCYMIYDDARCPWKTYKDNLPEFVREKPILDIGCGRDDGLAKILLRAGASSYHGVDIDSSAIAACKRDFPQHTFSCDDPRYVLAHLSEPHMMVSSGFFDLSIIDHRQYAQTLIQAIFKQTPVGWHTIHSSWNFSSWFHSSFKKEGFIPVRRGLDESFGIYRRRR
jgi:trans-aconitate methyltransferase